MTDFGGFFERDSSGGITGTKRRCDDFEKIICSICRRDLGDNAEFSDSVLYGVYPNNVEFKACASVSS